MSWQDPKFGPRRRFISPPPQEAQMRPTLPSLRAFTPPSNDANDAVASLPGETPQFIPPKARMIRPAEMLAPPELPTRMLAPSELEGVPLGLRPEITPTLQEDVPEPRRMRSIAPSPYEQRLLALAERMPTYEQYKPGKITRLAAALAGFGAGVTQGGAEGIKAAQAIKLEPYTRAMNEWKMQYEATTPLLNLETERARLAETSYRNDISLYNTMSREITANMREGEKARHNKALEKFAEIRAGKQTDFQAWMGLATADPEAARTLRQLWTGRLSYGEQLKLQQALADTRHKGRMAEIGVQVGAAEKRLTIAEAGRGERLTTAEAGRMERLRTGAKPLTERQRAEQTYHGTRRLLEEHPEYKYFIEPEDLTNLETIKKFRVRNRSEINFDKLTRELMSANPNLTARTARDAAINTYLDYLDALDTLIGTRYEVEEVK